MNIAKDDLKFVKELSWWTADRRNPYIVKGGIADGQYYLLISDLKNAWFRKADKHIVMQEKEKFNKALQVTSTQGILDILVKPISNFDKQAEYTFTHMKTEDSLLFEINTIINIYPLKWQFMCYRVESEQFFEVLTEDVVNPLICTLKAMETRISLIKKQYHDLETDYVKRLNDKEKQMYRSRLEDTEEYWKYLVQENPLDTKLTDIDLSEASSFFMKTYSLQRIKKQEELDAKLEKERQEKENRKRKADQITNTQIKNVGQAIQSTYADEYVENIEEINKKIELDAKLKKQVENKGKKPKMTFL